MSNLSDAISLLEEAEEFVDLEAETNESKATALLAMADRIRVCNGGQGMFTKEVQELAKSCKDVLAHLERCGFEEVNHLQLKRILKDLNANNKEVFQ